MSDEHAIRVLPGFVEHHCHFRGWAAQHVHLDLSGVTSSDELLTRVAACDDPWVIGRGLHDTALEHTHDIARRLDAAAGGRPVALTSRDGHALITTPRTIVQLGLDLDQLDVPGAVIERDADGTWTGVLREHPVWVVRAALPATLTIDAHRDAVREAARHGVTAIHDMDGLAALRDWAKLHDADGRLDARVTVHLLADDLDSIDEARSLERDGFLRIGGLKLFADGTLGSGTALLHAPELPRPGHAPRAGVAILTPSAIDAHARHAANLGLALLVHAIGDRAATNVIDALEATRDAWEHLPAQPRIEHAQLMRPADIERCARLGIALSVQPTMLVTDRDVADAHWGAERTPHAYAYRAMLDAGCTLLFGSDAPVEPLHPLAAIHAAVHRDGGAHGLPPARGAWHPEQCIDLEAALTATIGSRARSAGPSDDAVHIVGSDAATWRVVATRLGERWTFRTDH